MAVKLDISYYLTDIFYGGEALTAGAPQSYTCPLCGRMGFSEATLQEHVAAEHADNTTEVVTVLLYFLYRKSKDYINLLKKKSA